MMSFRGGIVFALLIQFLVVAIDKGGGLILYLLCTNHPNQHGLAGLVSTAPFVLMAVANLGLTSSQVYFLRKGAFTPQQTFGTNMTVALVWGGAVGLVAAAVLLWLLPALGPEWRVPPAIVWPLCVLVPMLLVSSSANTVQLATDHVRGYTLVHLATSLLFLPAFLGFFFFFGGDVEYADASYAMAWGRLLSSALVMLLVLWLVRGIVRLRLGLHRDYLRAGLRYGWRANLMSTLTYLNHRLDLYIVGWIFLGAGPVAATESERFAQVGFYSVAVTWAELVWHFPDALRDLFFSKVAGSTPAAARDLTPVLTRLALAASVVSGAAVLLLVNPVMGTITQLFRGTSAGWTHGWSDEVTAALLWLTPGTVAYTVTKVLQADLAGRDRQTVCVRAQWLAFAAMLALDFLWVPKYGATGAAAASSVAYVLATVYTVAVYVLETGTPLVRCLVPRRSDLVHFRGIVAAVLAKLRRT